MSLRKILALVVFCLLSLHTMGQTLYGTTTGADTNGAVFSVSSDKTDLAILASDGQPTAPRSDLLYHNERMWGLSSYGGLYNGGALFSVDLNLEDLQIHHHFYDSSGIRPFGALILIDGYFWGTAAEGGQSQSGVVFRTHSDGTGYTRVLDNELDTPGAELIELDGQIYGYADGGADDYGIIFRVDVDGQNFESIHDFDGIDGLLPDGKLTYDGSKLWGVTKYSVSELNGSTTDAGVIFTINTDGSSFTVREKLIRRPNGSLVLYDGKLWGTTWGGGENLWGSIFSISTDGSVYQVEHSFDNSDVGKFPEGQLLENEGLFWGMTNQFGLFSFDPTTSEATHHHSFSQYNDSYPYGGLVKVNDQFWGTTLSSFGGTGSVFQIGTDGTGYSSLQFSILESELSPYGRYRYGMDFDGKLLLHENRLYGAATFGGELYNNYGGLFSVNRDGSDYQHLHYFELDEGEQPMGDMVILDGKLWGVNYKHGNSLAGTLYSYDLTSGEFDVALDFSNAGIEGYRPYPVVAHNGKLYGTLYYGGEKNRGLIYEYDPETETKTDLVELGFESALYPESIISIVDNVLYGSTVGGGNSRGVIFSLDLNGFSYEEIYAIEDVDVSITCSSSHFYIVSNYEGENNQGLIRKVSLDGTGSTVLYDLVAEDGDFIGEITYQSDQVWGATQSSGEHGLGFIFTFDETDGFQKFFDFNADTQSPTDNFQLLVIPEQEEPEIIFELSDHQYGDPSFELTATSNSDGDIEYSSSNPVVVSITDNIAQIIGTGSCTISASQSETSTYSPGLAEAELQIQKAPLTIIAEDITISTASSIPEFELVYEGFVNGETEADVTSPTASSSAIAGEAGDYDIVLADAEADNYDITLVNGTLSIVEKEETVITFSVSDYTYGDDSFELTATSNREDEIEYSSSDNAVISISDNLAEIVGAGTCTLTASQAETPTHEAGSEEVEVIIEKRSLTISVRDTTITTTASIPEFQLVYEGFVHDDSEENITAPSATTSAVEGTAGAYDIILSGGEAENYEINLVDGTLVIEKEEAVMTLEGSNYRYGDEPFYLAALSSSNATIEYTSSDPSVITVDGDQAQIVGAGICTLSAAQEENSTYSEASAQAEIQVAKASITITADNQTRLYGEENGPFTLTYEGFVNDDTTDDLGSLPETSTLADESSAVGEYAIEISAASDDNYEMTLVNGTLSVAKASLTISVQDTTITTTALIPDFQLVYEGFVNGDTEEDIVPPTVSTSATEGIAGEYSVMLTDGQAENYELSLVEGTLLIVDEPDPILGLRDIREGVQVYPNPAVDYFSLKHTGVVEGIEIFGSDGRKVSQFLEEREYYPIDNLNPGLYMIKVYGTDLRILRLFKN